MSTPMPSARIVTTPDVPNAKHDHLCDSSEVASSHETPASASSSSSGTVDPSSLDVPFPTDSPEFDEFLQYLNGLPANDISNLFNSVSSSNLEGLLEGSSSTGVEQPTIPQPGAGSTGEMPQSTLTNHAAGSTVYVIDPTLLAISIPPQESNDSMSRGSTGAPPTPTLVGSPLSLSDPDPLTPRWDFTFPEPDVACSDTGDLAGGFEGGGGVTDEGGPSGNRIDFGRGEDDHAVVDPKGKGKARDIGPVAQPTSVVGGGYGPETSASTNYDGPTPPIPSYPPVQQASIHYPSTSAQQHFMPTAQSTSSFPLQLLAQLQAVAAAAAARPQQHPPSTKVTNPNKADIIRRAQKMRNQLLAEVRRAKVELWETAMEGGCLALIAKDKSVVGNPTPANSRTR
ncbi:hypothetical protein C8Q75DRAFT_390214 [Abortiporus biennis]|nr:hypothetical protein C8Q75DRAFT_390214 [Abortiporus biennis]